MTAVGKTEWPRERLERLGPEALADHEVVSLVLGFGVRTRHVADLARDVLERAGGLSGLPRLTREQMQTVRGMGRAKAAQLMAAVELGRRCIVVRAPMRPRITSARNAADVLIPRFGSADTEVFGLLVLDARRRLLRVLQVSRGGTDHAPAHPRDVFRAALSADAGAVVLFHTHPSGDPSPSADDIRLTHQLVMAGGVIGVPVLDHLIIAQAAYFSFQERGLLASPVSTVIGPGRPGRLGAAVSAGSGPPKAGAGRRADAVAHSAETHGAAALIRLGSTPPDPAAMRATAARPKPADDAVGSLDKARSRGLGGIGVRAKRSAPVR